MEKVCETPLSCLEQVHKDVKNWISNLNFIIYEIDFLTKDLLNSYLYEPYTKELFDKNKNLNDKFKSITIESNALIKEIQNHNNKIGGIYECEGAKCDSLYSGNHLDIKEKYEVFEVYYQVSKKELMSYTTEILKHKKK